MKTIVCYGDSNTWGYNPGAGTRFPRDTRWTGILRKTLGEGYFIIEEGLNGRTTVWEDPIEGYKNGMTYLIPMLGSHNPIDLITIMLGTNDLKGRISVPASDIAAGAGNLVKAVLQSDAGINGKPPRVLLMAPPPVAPLQGTPFEELFEGAEVKSRRFAKHYHAVAKQYGCDFLDAGEFAKSSPIDAIHLEADEHRKLGEAVAAKIRKILK